jgi:putative polyhydroxyalkanoic acid system protein
MPLIDVTLEHRRSLEDARRALEDTVNQLTAQFSTMVSRVEWATDRNRVKIDGVGFWVEMTVDARVFHATGDIPVLGKLIGSRFPADLKQIVQRTFQKNLPQ